MVTKTRTRTESHGGALPWRTVDLTLQATRSAWLSTTRPDGRPHAAPVWFLWAEGAVYFATAPTSQKGVNLSIQDYGVLQVGDGDDVIIIEGQARLVADPTERQVIAEQYGKKYVEPVTGERAAIDWPGAALYRLDANKVMAWIYGNVAARTDWRWTS
jgi:nitroimidazol reductase NimA-like FMN-containing flavoprotein (pyridoxamine 5'-phosphate oxidase superfamily)